MKLTTLILSLFALTLVAQEDEPKFVKSLKKTPQVSLEELHEQVIDLDGKIIRIEFSKRSTIRQISYDLYECKLTDREGIQVLCTFDRAGFDRMKKFPTDGKRRYKLYGVARQGKDISFHARGYTVRDDEFRW